MESREVKMKQLELVWVLFNVDISKWAAPRGSSCVPAFITVSYFRIIHTRIDGSGLQANWNLNMDYSCVVDESGESPHYSFQTSWPICYAWNILDFFCNIFLVYRLNICCFRIASSWLFKSVSAFNVFFHGVTLMILLHWFLLFVFCFLKIIEWMVFWLLVLVQIKFVIK